MARNELQAALRDLSDEGLDLLLRVGLGTETRYRSDADAMADLIRKQSVIVQEITEGQLWAAGIGDEVQEFGRTAWAAAASVILRQRFPDGIAFTMPKLTAHEIFDEGFLDSPFGYASKMSLKRESSDKIDIWIKYPDA